MKITALIALALGTAASAQHYSDSCPPFQMKLHDGHAFQATCERDRQIGKGYRTTTLNLDRCFGIKDGELARIDNGHYSFNGCEACRMDEYRATWMWCMCEQPDGRLGSTDINLNKYVANRDGILCCGKYCAFHKD